MKPALTLLHGGRTPRDSDHESLHVELRAAHAERVVLADKLRGLTRSASRLLAGGHIAAAATYLDEVSRLVEQDAVRAASMESPCGCQSEGSGHGPADFDAVAERKVRTA